MRRTDALRVLITLVGLAPCLASAAPVDSIVGEWTVEGGGKVTIAHDAAAGYSLSRAGDSKSATFDGRALTVGDAGRLGVVKALERTHGSDGVAFVYTLSADGTKLEGARGPERETLTRSWPASGTVRLVILHTNDIHGQIVHTTTTPGFAALAGRIRRERAEALASGASVLTLDAGDMYIGTPEGSISNGRFMLDLMARAGYDAAALGNHDFDDGPRNLEELCRRSSFPLLGANVIDEKTGRRPGWLAATASFEMAGVPVRVIGMTVNSLKTITRADSSDGLDTRDQQATVDAELASRPEGAREVTIVLQHGGHVMDEKGRVAVVATGHSHMPIRAPQARGGPLVVHAGCYAQWVGRVELEVDRATGRVVKSSARLIGVTTADASEAADMEGAIDEATKALRASEDAPLGELASGLDLHQTGSLVADLLRDEMHADVGVHNVSGVRHSLQSGRVRLRDLHEISPFGNTAVILTLKGSELLEMLGSGNPRHVAVSGIEVRYDSRLPAEKRIQSVLVGGAALEPDRDYTVATNSFVADGPEDPVFKKGRDRKNTDVTVLELTRRYFAGRERVVPIDQKVERIVDVAKAP